MKLGEQKCEACRADSPRATDEQKRSYLTQLPDWRIVEHDGIERLHRVFQFADFAGAMTFANQVGEIAEAEGHHPLLIIEWGRVSVQWWTHKIRGLHINDFIMAAKTDGIRRL